MNNHQEPSLLFKYSFLAVFIAMTMGAFIWFGYSFVQLIEQISSLNPSIAFDKGSFYLLGVGVGLGALLYNMIYEGILKKELTTLVAKKITRVALFGLSILIILPQVAHYTVQNYLENNNYWICEQASSRWLIHRTIVYVSNDEVCEGLSNKKNVRHIKSNLLPRNTVH